MGHVRKPLNQLALENAVQKMNLASAMQAAEPIPSADARLETENSKLCVFPGETLLPHDTVPGRSGSLLCILSYPLPSLRIYPGGVVSKVTHSHPSDWLSYSLKDSYPILPVES